MLANVPGRFFVDSNVTTAWAPLVSLGVYTLVFVPVCVLFWLRRDKEPLRSRSAVMVLGQMFASLSCYVFHALGLYYNAIGETNTACELVYWGQTPFIGLSIMPFAVRGSRLYVQYMRGKLMVAESRLATGLPSDLKHMRLHSWTVDHLRWVMTIWGGLWSPIFTVLTFVAAFATYAANGYACTESGFALNKLAQGAVMAIVGNPVVFIVRLASTADVFSIRDELAVLSLTHMPILLLLLLALFEVIPVSIGIIDMIGFWICLINTLVWPVLQSYKFDWMRDDYLALVSKGSDDAKKKTASDLVNKFRKAAWWQRVFFHYYGSSTVMQQYGAADGLPDGTSGDGTSGGGGELGVTTTTSMTMSPEVEPTIDAIPLKPVLDRQESNGGGGNGGGKKIVHLSSLLRDPVECRRLQQLAVNCFSAEHVLFLIDLNRLRDCKLSITEQDRYIVENGPREVNIVHGTRQVLLSTFAALKKHDDQGTFDSSLENAVSLRTLFNAAEHEVKAIVRSNILPLWRPSAAQSPHIHLTGSATHVSM